MAKMNVKKLLKLARRMPEVSTPQAVQLVSLIAAAERSEDLTKPEVKAICGALGEAFNKIRKRAGITRRQFCEKSKISDGWLSQMEQGNAPLHSYSAALFNVALFASDRLASELLAQYEAELGLQIKPSDLSSLEPAS